jgi:hypothetical protein
MKDDKKIPQDLEKWLSAQPESDRRELRRTWNIFSQFKDSTMQTEHIDQTWNAISAATAPVRRNRMLWLRAAAAVALLATGWLAGRYAAPAATAAAADPVKPQYALLVKNNDTPPADGMQQFREYSAWIGNLKKERQAGGEALHGKAWRLHKTDAAVETTEYALKTSPDDISGYFLFEAENEAEALKIAQTCPHLNYGGTLELRQILSGK